MPERIAALPLSDRGYPIPFFVDYIDGKPEFRAMDRSKFIACVKRNLCWVCGQPLGRYKCFAIGPMCAINRISSEPPSHVECAEWSAKACPFLSNPEMVRREHGLPEDRRAAGVMVKRNPGVTLLWTVTKIELRQVHNGILFSLVEPVSVSWWKESRPATRSEVEESVAGGLPLLQQACANQEERAELERLVVAAGAYYPAS
jgi:hypothetical protein